MRDRVLFLTCLLLGFPATGFAATSPPGVNLRWDRCYGDGGAWNKNFACDTNVGIEQLVGSLELAQTLDRVVTAEITLDLRAESATLPAWWDMKNFGSCRPSALDFSTVPSLASSTCVEWASAPTGGGIAAYSIGTQGPAHVRLSAAVAIHRDRAATLFGAQEYFLFRLIISHVKTVGTGACGGCAVPVCMFLSRVSLFQTNSTAATINLEQGANYLGSQYVTWQNGYPIDVHRVCDAPASTCERHYTVFGCVLATPTRSRVSTWGQVKALYR